MACSDTPSASVNRTLPGDQTMSLAKPALDPKSLETENRSGYPEPYRSRVLPRTKRRLGDALGLKHVGINHSVLPAGRESSMRHWHTHEDEFVYVLEGEVVLRTDAGEQLLRAGMCAGFPAGSQDGHQLINRSNRDAVYLEVSNRDPADLVYYTDPEVDLAWNGATRSFTRRDGSAI
jgi:uncharacterized cupin superfamily protein